MNKARTRFFTVFLTVLSFCGSVSAQLIEMPDFELISEKEGLPFNSISDFVHDKKGFLWVAGLNSLARFDGYNFLEIPSQKEEHSISRSIITSLSTDINGLIWVGCLKGRVFSLDPETLETSFYQLGEPSATSLSTKMYGDRSGNVWGFVEGIGLFKLADSTFRFVGALTDLPQKAQAHPNYYNRLGSFYEESADMLWLASTNGLYTVDVKKSDIKHISSLSEDVNQPAFVHYLVADETGFWCSTYGTGLIHFNRETGNFKKYLFEPGSPGTSNIIYGMARKSDHELWISSSGLGVFNEQTNKFSFYYDRNDINIAIASYSMISGKDGIIWLLTDKGLLKCSPEQNKFNYFKLNVTKTDNRGYYGINTVLDDPATGRKIIGTSFADGLHIFDAGGHETILSFAVHPQAEPYLIVHEIMKTQEGKILVLTRDLLYELTPDNKLVKVPGPDALLPSSTVPFFYRMIQSSSGDFWIASSRNGLFHYNQKSNQWKLFTGDTNTLANKRVFRVEEDNHHKIWAAHPLHGISIFDPSTETWSYLKHSAGDTLGLVSDVYTDFSKAPDGKMIFSTLEGISIIDPATNNIRNFSGSSSLANRSVYCALADSAGNVWAVTNRGLTVVNTEGQLIREFTAADGLKGAYPSFLMRAQRGEMQICTFQGFYSFYPTQALRETLNTAPLYITGVINQKANLAGFGAPTDIKIKYAANSLSIRFALMNFLGSQRNKYRYKMEGLDDHWLETLSNEVNYSGIPSGGYTFKVQSVDGKSEASIPVFVSTPFYKQWWFRALTTLMMLGLFYTIYRLRLDKIRSDEKLKREFSQKLAEVEMKALKAQMSPHFIFNSLNSINRYIVKSEPEKASMYLTKFSKLIRLILDNSNSKIISLEQELTSLKLYIELEALRFNDKFSYKLMVSSDLNPLSIGVPPMIIQPFVENAIWHGLLHQEAPGVLTIAVSRFGHGLQCVIEDNGVGRKKAAELKSKSVNKEKSYGMKLTKERLSMLNGESKVSSVDIIDLEDEQGRATGTKVIVKIMTAELEPEF